MITKKAKQEFLKTKLSTDSRWAIKAMLLIYSKQTHDEQLQGSTEHDNGIGFSGAHAEIMSSFAKQYQKWNKLSDKQLKIVFKIMPKYWKQVLGCSNEQKLIASMLNDNVITHEQAVIALL